MKQNVAGQVIGAQMVSAADGSAFTGAVTVFVTGDGGTQAAGSVGAGACTHEGNGFHTYAPSQAETNSAHIAFTFIGTGAVPVTVQLYTTFPQSADNLDAAGVRAAVGMASANLDTQLAAIPTDTAAPGDAMTLTPAERTAVANEVEAQIINEADAEQVLTAITNKIAEANPDLGGLTLAAIAAQVRTELTVELARLDVAISTRLAAAGYTVPPTAAANATAVRTELAVELARVDAAVSTRATPAQVATELGTYDAPTKSELDAAVAPLATAAELALVKAKTDVLPAAPAAVGDIPTAVQNADALLGRNIAGGSSAGRTVTSALRRIRNRVAIAGGIMSAYQEDDVTVDHTAAVTTAAGDPITEVDPT